MAENDNEQGQLPVSGNPFTHQSIRMALQSAIMDEIIVDGGGTYQIRVPDTLIDRLEAILSPHFDNLVLAELVAAIAPLKSSGKHITHLDRRLGAAVRAAVAVLNGEPVPGHG